VPPKTKQNTTKTKNKNGATAAHIHTLNLKPWKKNSAKTSPVK